MNDDIDDDPDTDNTERKQSGLIPFKPGQSGNPTGRPKGSRNKLTEEFLADLVADWQIGGIEALKIARETKPEVYCKMVASLLPKQVQLKDDELSDLTDEQLAALSTLIANLIGDSAGEEQEAGKATLQ